MVEYAFTFCTLRVEPEALSKLYLLPTSLLSLGEHGEDAGEVSDVCQPWSNFHYYLYQSYIIHLDYFILGQT